VSQDGEWISAGAAARLLGVKPATLYAYVSRGLIRSRSSSAGAGGRRYARSDLERHLARSLARKGHAAVASGALSFGEPVLDTRVSNITRDGPVYRGQAAVALAEADTPPERVAELLAHGTLPERTPEILLEAASMSRLRRWIPRDTPPLRAMLLALIHAEPRDNQLDWARELVRLLAVSPALGGGEQILRAAISAPTLAGALLAALGRRTDPRARRVMNRALVLSADHELNASTFAARIAAGAGADLAHCLAAALGVLSGARHGGASDGVEAFVADLERPEHAITRVRECLAAGQAVPGFGHPLYPDGDPRAPPLIAAAEAVGRVPRVARTLAAVREAMRLAGGEGPNIDHALVVVRAALGLPAGSASAIFAVGRAMGYVAHVFEQRASGQLLRPRARYVGP
jgi:citrate synthase